MAKKGIECLLSFVVSLQISNFESTHQKLRAPFRHQMCIPHPARVSVFWRTLLYYKLDIWWTIFVHLIFDAQFLLLWQHKGNIRKNCTPPPPPPCFGKTQQAFVNELCCLLCRHDFLVLTEVGISIRRTFLLLRCAPPVVACISGGDPSSSLWSARLVH